MNRKKQLTKKERQAMLRNDVRLMASWQFLQETGKHYPRPLTKEERRRAIQLHRLKNVVTWIDSGVFNDVLDTPAKREGMIAYVTTFVFGADFVAGFADNDEKGTK